MNIQFSPYNQYIRAYQPTYSKQSSKNTMSKNVSFEGLPSFEKIKTQAASILYRPNPIQYKTDEKPKDNYSSLKKRMEAFELDYDPMDPGVTAALKENREETMLRKYLGVGDKKKIRITERNIPTKNRENNTIFVPPKFKEGEALTFTVPVQETITPIKTPPKKIKSHGEQTVIELDYGKSVNWNEEKIARDLLQNFFDGHNQTLDGVKFDFTPKENGRYNVRIEGKSTFDPDKAIMLGETTKREDKNAAGNYGEGLKMTVLKLLSDYDIETCDVGSNNWNLRWDKQKSKINGKDVLSYNLTEEKQFNGSYLEFETGDTKIIQALIDGVKKFYHSGNEDFICPDFENQYIGIKLLNKDKKGGFYITGQQFEFEGDYGNFPEACIFIKEKPPVTVFNPTRDRDSLDNYDVRRLAEYCAKTSKPTDAVKMLNTLRDYWEYNPNYWNHSAMEYLLEGVIDGANEHDIEIKFPENYISIDSTKEYHSNSAQVANATGNKLCKIDFAKIGMPKLSIWSIIHGANKPVEPDGNQIKKIGILREGIKLFEHSFKNEFTKKEVNAKIYLFDAKDLTAGESITYGGICHGMWINTGTFDSDDFPSILATALHELSHKAGEDGDSNFSYKLTDVLRQVLRETAENPVLAYKLRDLSRLWKEYSPKAASNVEDKPQKGNNK